MCQTDNAAFYTYRFPDGHLDNDALKVIDRLERFGHVAYLVGGCVRDLLLGLRPKDYDVATSATPRQAKKLFGNSRIIGRRFRLVHVTFGSKIIELSTFRRSVAPGDGKDLLITMDNVFGTPREDVMRRDFTVNALYYSPSREQIIDYVGGIDDLKARRVMTIGEPGVRFREDPVRMIRAVKLATRANLTIDPSVVRAIEECHEDLNRSSPPRIIEEVYKILGSGAAADTFRFFFDTGVMATLFPVLDERLKATGPPSPEDLWQSLGALDEADKGERRFSNPVLLGSLLQPFFASPFATGEKLPHPSDDSVNDIIRACLGLESVSRRERERVRQCLLAQARFVKIADARRFSIASFSRKPYFSEALALFSLNCAATGKAVEELEKWRLGLAGK